MHDRGIAVRTAGSAEADIEKTKARAGAVFVALEERQGAFQAPRDFLRA